MDDTLDYKISVMQAAKEGEEIESQNKLIADDTWRTIPVPCWNWAQYDYRVKAQEPIRVMISLKCGVPVETWKPSPVPHYHSGDYAAEFIELTPEIKQKLGL